MGRGRPKGSFGKARREKESHPKSLDAPELQAPAAVAVAETAAPEVPSAFPGADAGPEVERISFKLTPDGKLDYDSLRPSSAAKLKETLAASLKDDGFKKWAGIAAADIPKIQLVSPQLFGVLLDAGVGIEAGIFSKKYALPAEEIRKVIAWTPADHALLDGQGANICNKYIPATWLNYGDIGIFAISLLSAINAKSRMVEAYAHAQLEKLGKAGTQPAPAQPSTNGGPTNGAAAPVAASIPPGETSRSLEEPQ